MSTGQSVWLRYIGSLSSLFHQELPEGGKCAGISNSGNLSNGTCHSGEPRDPTFIVDAVSSWDYCHLVAGVDT